MKKENDILYIGDEGFFVRVGTKFDEEEAMKLYRAAIGTPFCTWSLEYPNHEIFEMDTEYNNLFCLCNESGLIIALISIDKDENTDKLECWNKTVGKTGELSRLVVREEYQNKGIASEFIIKVMDIMKERGYKSVHYLVSKRHKKALAAYKKLEFTLVGESDLFGCDWFCYEKIL